MMVRMIAGGILVAALAGVTDPASGQDRGRRGRDRFSSVDFMAGATRYDIDRTGTGATGALRVSLASGRIFVIEPGIGFLRYQNQLGENISYLLPEVSIQVEPSGGSIRPYLGVGAGFTEFLSGRGSNYATMHVATGLRGRLSEGWGIRADVRARTIDPFRQSTVDFTFGLSRRLGPD